MPAKDELFVRHLSPKRKSRKERNRRKRMHHSLRKHSSILSPVYISSLFFHLALAPVIGEAMMCNLGFVC